jgi:hypothetical protein
VTVEYIVKKGSACVEAFREISHLVAQFFGDIDRPRRHKKVAFEMDMKTLVAEMIRENAHELKENRPITVMVSDENSEVKGAMRLKVPKSAIYDIIVEGAGLWQTKWADFIKETTYDPALGYPIGHEEGEREPRLSNGSGFDDVENPLAFDSYIDIDGEGLGGGNEWSSGDDTSN